MYECVGMCLRGTGEHSRVWVIFLYPALPCFFETGSGRLTGGQEFGIPCLCLPSAEITGAQSYSFSLPSLGDSGFHA